MFFWMLIAFAVTMPGAMSFHLGKPILVMICCALVTAGFVATRRPAPRADLTVWCFADSHAISFRGDAASRADGIEAPAGRFTRLTGLSVNVQLIGYRAEDVRLLSMFNSDSDVDVPDCAEIEIGAVGKYFRAPVSEVGFLPLNDYLKKSGWYDKILHARFAPWSKEGLIFGVPHDLHPTTISYRKDLYDQAGVDLESAKTWPEFQEKCLAFQSYWRAHGEPGRRAIGLAATGADQLIVMLMQRHINLLDDHNRIYIDDEKVAQTLSFYAQLVAGPRRIAGEFNVTPGQSERQIVDGQLCARVTPDWQVGYLKLFGGGASGKMRMMPLPRFDPQDAQTASWGGTMIGIPRKCKDPDKAWRLIEALYLDHDSIAFRRRMNAILPPITAYWNDPVYSEPDPYFAGQQRDELFIRLARDLPPRYVTPFTTIAIGLLSDVLNKTTARIDRGETEGLETDIRAWLKDAHDDLARRIEFGTFD